jgi:hypothetical protein
MATDITDLRNTIIPRSDQLNSEQLLGGPMILTVSDVQAGGGEDQPVSIFYAADPGRPFKPCKTMRKVLILAWGPDGTKWIGKSMELYCEPSVKFGGEVVGGIRISRLSDIPKEIKVSLTATKGRKSMHEIRPLTASPELTAVLAAITAATGRESLQKAKALAERLTADADIAFARAAYAKKVAALKSAPPPKPAAPVIPDDLDDGGFDDGSEGSGQAREGTQQPAGAADGSAPLVSYARLAERLKKTEDRDIAALVLDEGRALPPDQQKELGALFFEKFGE